MISKWKTLDIFSKFLPFIYTVLNKIGGHKTRTGNLKPQDPLEYVIVVLYFSYFSFFFGRRAPRSFILSFMLNLLLRSTTKEHFREKNQLMSDVISTLIHKYYLLKLIARHQIKITRKKISIFIQVFLFLTFPSKHITYHSLLLLLWLSFLILSFSSSMTGSPLTSSAPGSNLIPPSLRSEPESWRKWKYSASVSVGSVSS